MSQIHYRNCFSLTKSITNSLCIYFIKEKESRCVFADLRPLSMDCNWWFWCNYNCISFGKLYESESSGLGNRSVLEKQWHNYIFATRKSHTHTQNLLHESTLANFYFIIMRLQLLLPLLLLLLKSESENKVTSYSYERYVLESRFEKMLHPVSLYHILFGDTFYRLRRRRCCRRRRCHCHGKLQTSCLKINDSQLSAARLTSILPTWLVSTWSTSYIKSPLSQFKLNVANHMDSGLVTLCYKMKRQRCIIANKKYITQYIYVFNSK